MSDINKQKYRSAGKIITKATWFILVSAMTVIGVLAYYVVQFEGIYQKEIHTLQSIDSFQKNINIAINGVYETIDNGKESRLGLDPVYDIDLSIIKESYVELEGFYAEELNAEKMDSDSIQFFFSVLNKYHSNVEGISILANDKNGGLIDNQTIFKSQLRKSLHEITLILSRLRDVSSNRLLFISDKIYWVSLIQVLFFMLLAVYGYVRVIIPFKIVFRETRRLTNKYKGERDESIIKMELAISKENEIEGNWKIKQAEVLKLQKSLEESIQQISRLSKERSFIYLNTATELEGYLKVVNKQKEIIENQTDIKENENWSTLKGSIAQLNSLVGDNFNKAKQSINSDLDSEVYLSQLISEIVLSTSSSDETNFEQVADMPSIKTNVNSLKAALKPYFNMISKYDGTNRINVSAFESGSVCEFKFVGLSTNCIEKIEEINKKEAVDLEFNEFKVYMAKRAINRRGGKVWGQQDVANKGVFCIRWVL